MLAQHERASNPFPWVSGGKLPLMLVPNGRPPQFRLPDSRGQETELAEFLGRRVLLVFSPARVVFDALTANSSGLNERDMVVLVLLPPARPFFPTPATPPVLVLRDDGRAASAYGTPPGEPFFCLIGKDGTIKQSGPLIPTPVELFETVDAMPLRRQEIRETSRGERS